MKILMLIQYDGTEYCGWQSQKNGVSVQSKVEEALFAFIGSEIRVTASGRTDAGVHARAQAVHFVTDKALPPECFAPALNQLLPNDIVVLSSKRVADDFNARYSCKVKTYSYQIYRSDKQLPLMNRYCTRVDSFNIDKMNEAARLIEGNHDFKAFSASGSSVKTTNRTVYSIKIEKGSEHQDAASIFVSGNGFLYNMVRIIVGVLLAYSNDKITLDDIKLALETGQRIKKAKTMPPEGLTLESVEYT